MANVAVEAVMNERESYNTVRRHDPKVTYILKSIFISKINRRRRNWIQTSPGSCIVDVELLYQGTRSRADMFPFIL